MTTDDYKRQLARLRRMLGGVTGPAPLPDYLRPENIEVSAETKARAQRIRDAVLRGDAEAVRTASPELLSAGFDRSEAGEDLPELDEARDRVQERLQKKQKGDDADSSRDRCDRSS
jgi:Arc/MetJ family transcription regulator